MQQETLAPGLYPDVPDYIYHSWQFAVGQSTLKTVREYTERHAYDAFISPQDPKAHLTFGHAMHLAALQPVEFEDQVVCGLTVTKQSDKNKRLWREFEEENEGKIILRLPEYEKCLLMAQAIRDHPVASQLVTMPGSMKEVSVVWEDPDEKILCKARYDIFGRWPLNDWNVIADVKSTATDLSDESLRREIGRWGYDVQAAYYLDGAEALSPGVPRRFLLIFVTKDDPHYIRVIEPNGAALEEGRTKYRMSLRRWAKCLKTGKFPGWPNKVTQLGLLSWHEVKDWELDRELEEQAHG